MSTAPSSKGTDAVRTWRAEAGAGVRDALAMVVPSIVAYGIVWGGLARQTGLSVGEVVAMCLLVSAGTAQLVALPMLAAGAPAALLVLTTYVVNLRHYLMAASLAGYWRHLRRPTLALLGHLVTDETYALTQARYATHPPRPAYFVGCGVTVYLAFYIGAVVGALLGQQVPDPRRFGLDFVFPAVFVAILAQSIQARWQAVVAVAAGAIALAVAWWVGGTWHIVVAGLTAAGLGVWLAPAAAGGLTVR
jgi:branched chain amino acid efflux pump